MTNIKAFSVMSCSSRLRGLYFDVSADIIIMLMFVLESWYLP